MEPAIYQMLHAVQILGKSIPDKENSKGKGPDVSVSGVLEEQPCGWYRWSKEKGREVIGLSAHENQIMSGLMSHREALAFTPSKRVSLEGFE